MLIWSPTVLYGEHPKPGPSPLYRAYVSRADEVDEQLAALYEQVPEINCKGLCADACGPIDGGPREKVRMRRAGVKLPPRHEAVKAMIASEGNYECPALSDGQCSVYDVRPMVCRIWGAVDDMTCPYGCLPAPGQRRLNTAEAVALIDAANKAGTIEQPRTKEEFERALENPQAREALRQLLRQPTKRA